jgi:hypothetical protein
MSRSADDESRGFVRGHNASVCSLGLLREAKSLLLRADQRGVSLLWRTTSAALSE